MYKPVVPLLLSKRAGPITPSLTCTFSVENVQENDLENICLHLEKLISVLGGVLE